MFGLETLDIMIGLITVYLVFGMACTAIVEAAMVWFNIRSNNLEQALCEFFADDLDQKDTNKFVNQFYAHPLVQSLSKGKDGRPSYIPPHIVSQVVENILTANGTLNNIETGISSLPESRIKSLLTMFARQAKNDINEFNKAVESHFDSTMDRASGWVKRRSHNITLVVSIILVVCANLDTVSLTNSLAANPEARLKLVEIAQQHVNETTKDNPPANPDLAKTTEAAKTALTEATANLESAGVNLGWKEWPEDCAAWVSKIAGLLVSVFAVSLGAPFWFDVLQKFMQVRTAGVSTREAKKK